MKYEDWRRTPMLKRKRGRCLGLLVGAVEVCAFERQARRIKVVTRAYYFFKGLGIYVR